MMQRVPSKGTPIKNVSGINIGSGKSTGSYSGGSNAVAAGSEYERRADLPGEAVTPLMLLARRIRDEQGVDQLKEFLLAMTPFAAPGELKSTGERFGVTVPASQSFASSAAQETLRGQNDYRHANAGNGDSAGPAVQNRQPSMPPQMQMLRTLMLLQNLFGAPSSGQNNTGIDTASLLRALSSFGQQQGTF